MHHCLNVDTQSGGQFVQIRHNFRTTDSGTQGRSECMTVLVLEAGKPAGCEDLRHWRTRSSAELQDLLAGPSPRGVDMVIGAHG